MNKISAVILAKNAEDLIADCIDSVSFCDEVILIDDNSSDRTAELAKLLGVKVYQHEFQSFADRRNYGARKAKYTWILYVDADERVSKELAESIKKHVGSSRASEFSAYKIQRKNFYLGDHEWPYIEKLERLFNRDSLAGWRGELHESPEVKGQIGELEGFLLHYTHRDLTSMVEKTTSWSETEAKLRLQAHHPKMAPWRFFRVMLTAFYDSYVKQKGYKAGTAGLIESIYQGFSIFITYARLWELQNNLKNEK